MGLHGVDLITKKWVINIIKTNFTKGLRWNDLHINEYISVKGHQIFGVV
jgi:hypothetical protein